MAKRARPGSPLVAVAYIRASRDEQRLGPEAQRTSIEAWAAREGVSVVAWHVDQGVCSVTPIEERAGLVAALASLREHGAGVFVVGKRDRIARDPMLTRSIERAAASAGARVVSAAGEGNGDTPADAFMRTVIDGAAEYERGLIRARTKGALKAKRDKGERVGSVAYGYRLDVDGVHLVTCEAEQETIARARQLRADGLSLRAVADALTGEGRVSRVGKPFAAAQVNAMCGFVRRAAA
jgi:DNA invertase Pin-like site-specific DNA recombinase